MTAALLRRSPYQGLTPFTEEDAAYFFGRQNQTRLIVADLFAAPLSVLYGGSGVGKSSVLRAGVLRELGQRGEFCSTLFNQWQSPPLDALKGSILTAAASRLGLESERYRELEAWARVHPANENLPEFLQGMTERLGCRLVLILDQFEEYWVYHGRDEVFGDQFAAAACSANPRLSILVSLREEALAGLDRFDGQIPNLFENSRRLEHLDYRQARDAIVMPIAEYRRRHPDAEGPTEIEEELIVDVLSQVRSGQVHVGNIGRGTTDDAAEGRVEAPYLQLVMTRLWAEEIKQQSSLLRASTLAALGGAEAIVAGHLQSVMDRLSDEQREVAAKVFQFLVTPSGSKIAHSAKDLAGMAGTDEDATRETLARLDDPDDRIVREVAAAPDHPGVKRYEIFHDRLAPAVLGWRVRYASERSRTESVRETVDTLHGIVESFLDGLDSPFKELATAVLPLLVANATVTRSDLAAAAARAGTVLGVPAAETSQQLDHLLTSLGALVKADSGGQSYSLASGALNQIVSSWVDRRSAAPDLPEAAKPTSFFSRVFRLSTALRLGQAIAGLSPPEPPAAGSAATPSPPPYAMIASLLDKGLVTVVIGDGAAIDMRTGAWQSGAGVPAHRELTAWIAGRIAFPHDPGAPAPSLGEVSSYCVAEGGIEMLDGLIREAFGSGAEPTPVHRYLAGVACRAPLLVLTTRVDDLLELAFAETGIAYDLLYNVTGSEGIGVRRVQPGASKPESIDPIRFARDVDRPCIYKLFGSWSPERVGSDTFIATEESQMALFAEILGGRLPPRALRSQLDSAHSLYLGVSLRGWAERQLVPLLRAHGAKQAGSAWAVASAVSPLDRSRWTSLGVKLIDENAERFVADLSQVDIELSTAAM